MYNYAKNGVSINKEAMDKINAFNEVARTLATESVAHTAKKHELTEAMEALIKAEAEADKIKEAQAILEAENDRWTIRNKELNKMLFGEKGAEGVCDLVSNDLYKAYVKYVKEGTTKDYRAALKTFCENLVIEDAIKDGAFNHLFNDIVATMSSVKYNSNKNIAEGCAYITTINKRTYKKMLCGAIHDIVSNNRTLKVKKATTK